MEKALVLDAGAEASSPQAAITHITQSRGLRIRGVHWLTAPELSPKSRAPEELLPSEGCRGQGAPHLALVSLSTAVDIS